MRWVLIWQCPFHLESSGFGGNNKFMDFRMAPRLIRLDFVESISKPQTGRICFACGINKSRWLPKGLHPGKSKLGMGHCHLFSEPKAPGGETNGEEASPWARGRGGGTVWERSHPPHLTYDFAPKAPQSPTPQTPNFFSLRWFTIFGTFFPPVIHHFWPNIWLFSPPVIFHIYQ